MGDEFRRELGHAFDQMSGSPNPALPDRVRATLANPPQRPQPYWIAGVAAVAIAALVITVLFVGHPFNRQPSSGVPAGRPTPTAVTTTASPSGSPATASPTPSALACSTSTATFTSSGPVTAFVDALRTGQHSGYDRLTVEFSNGQPRSAQVTWQASPAFVLSPSGQSVVLKGDHGLLITLQGADLHSAYSGPIDIVVNGKGLAEVRRVQDFEGTVQLGIGVNGTGCFHASWLSNPARLVIDIAT